ncbi:uncharacterized protein [Misgurnus anguillicaudatus]|uniref:uncharacterized protein n=1 Tax=Misgurnus anguillicaudatus TaxID=75329 RepID=UPI003CCF1BB5
MDHLKPYLEEMPRIPHKIKAKKNGQDTTTASTTTITDSTTSAATFITGSTNTTTASAVTVTGSTNTTTASAAPVTGSTNTTTASAATVTGSTNATTASAAPATGSTNTTTASAATVTGSTNATTASAATVTGSTNATTASAATVTGSTNTTTASAATVTGSTNTTTASAATITATTGSSNSVENYIRDAWNGKSFHLLLSRIGPYTFFFWDIARTAPNMELEDLVVNSYLLILVRRYNSTHLEQAVSIDSFEMPRIWKNEKSKLKILFPQQQRTILLDPFRASPSKLRRCQGHSYRTEVIHQKSGPVKHFLIHCKEIQLHVECFP